MSENLENLTGEKSLATEMDNGLIARRAFLKRSALAGLGVAGIYVAPQITSVMSKPAYASATQVCVPEFCLNWGRHSVSIEPFQYGGTVQEFYNHRGQYRDTPGEVEHDHSANTPWDFFKPANPNLKADRGIEELRNASSRRPIGDLLMFFMLRDKTGRLSLFTILDTPKDGDGGSAKICYYGLPANVAWSVKDDSADNRDSHTVDGAGNALLNTRWNKCCTDGGVLSFLPDCKGKICVEYKRKNRKILKGIDNVCFVTRRPNGDAAFIEMGKKPWCIEIKPSDLRY